MCGVGDRLLAAVNRWDSLTRLGALNFSRKKVLYRINQLINLVSHVAVSSSQSASQSFKAFHNQVLLCTAMDIQLLLLLLLLLWAWGSVVVKVLRY